MAYSNLVAELDEGLSTMDPRPTAAELGAWLEVDASTAGNYTVLKTSGDTHVLMPERPGVQRFVHMAAELMGTDCANAFGAYLLDKWPASGLSREEAIRRADYMEAGGSIAAARMRTLANSADFDTAKRDQGKKRPRELKAPERAVLSVLVKNQSSVADVMARKALMTRHGVKRTNCNAIMARFARWAYVDRVNVGIPGRPAWEYAVTAEGKAAFKRKAPAKAA